jgi:elongation factor P
MANTSDFKNGMIFHHKNGLWKIVEFQHVKPGKGPAFVRTKLKNIKTGQVVEETFRSGEKIDVVKIEAKDYTYLYSDGSLYTFMNSDTYEQITLSDNQLGNNVLDFLITNTKTTIAFDRNDPVEVRIPSHMNIKVVKTDPGEKGNTAQGGTKPAVLESGITINVPLFINNDDLIRVDTRDKKYIERVK